LESTTSKDIREVAASSPGISMTGPILVEGAEPGDVLGVEVCEISTGSWGYTVVSPGFGLLTEDFPEPAFRSWNLSNGYSAKFDDSITVPLHPFLGAVGVAPPAGQVLPTIPPSRWGGNIDIKRLTTGAILYLPVATSGALLSVGDAHAAQGDGEVCGAAIETSACAVLRVSLHKDRVIKYPALHTVAPKPDIFRDGAHITSGIGDNLFTAAQDAIREMITWLEENCELASVDAYMLCSVCVDLAICEIVDRPNWVVSAALPLSIFNHDPPIGP
jgi:acetamidase/formamidase